GAHASTPAYIVKKRYVLNRVSKNRRAASLTPAGSYRFGTQGLDDVMKYHRSASDPCSAIASQGFTTFPFDFDIFWPSASRMRSFTITFRYAGPRPSSVEIAMSE